jgi:hypothetical protein
VAEMGQISGEVKETKATAVLSPISDRIEGLRISRNKAKKNSVSLTRYFDNI